MAQVDRTGIAQDVPRFLTILAQIPWFQNLGEPHPWDQEVVRIHSWDEWLGPERGHGDWFGRWPAFVRESIQDRERARRVELETLWQRTYDLVHERAACNVPLFDPKQDAWYGPTNCVNSAAYISALVAWHLLLERPIPKMIAGEWCWLAEGHWPCDFADAPVGIDEALVDFAFKFQVY